MDTGDIVNIANFQKMISSVNGYGGVYKPSNSDIEASKLQNKFDAFNAELDTRDTDNAGEDAAATDRENLFKPLSPLITASVNYYDSTGAEDNKIADAKGFQRKIQGARAKAITPTAPGATPPKNISVAQLSYENRVEHLDGIIEVYKTDSNYAPNENKLATASLDAYSVQLKAANANAINTVTTAANSEKVFKTGLYAPKTGICDLAGLVKKYVKSLFGASSPEFKQISGLVFRKKKL